MDFYQICTRETKGVTELYPDFTVGRSKDLMVRGKSFYAVWDEEQGLWSTDEYDVQRLIDEELRAFDAKNDVPYNVKYLRSASNGGWYAFQKFLKNVSDNAQYQDIIKKLEKGSEISEIDAHRHIPATKISQVYKDVIYKII